MKIQENSGRLFRNSAVRKQCSAEKNSVNDFFEFTSWPNAMSLKDRCERKNGTKGRKEKGGKG